MIKYLKYILIVCPIILSILLVVNIYKYTNNKIKNNSLLENTKNYELKITENNTKQEQLEKELTLLKEEKEDKIWELNRWIKWNKEIKEKMN